MSLKVDVRIGIVVKALSPRSFWLRVFDDFEDRVSIGTFVMLENKECTNCTPVLARICRIVRRNFLTDERLIAQLSDEGVVEALRGYGIDLQYLTHITLAKAVVIGYKRNDRLYKPRKPPRPMDYVYLPERGELEEFLRLGDEPLIEIGIVEGTDIPARLSGTKLVTQHLAILASTGGGKSWLAGVIIEELIRKGDVSVVVIDPHGEYSAMQVPADDSEEAREIAEAVRIYVPGKADTRYIDEYFETRYGRRRRITRFGLNPRSLPLGLLEALLDYYYGLSLAQKRLLEEAWQYVGYSNEITPLEELLGEIREYAEKASKGYSSHVALETLTSKLRVLFESKPFFILRPGESFNGEPIRLLDIDWLLEYGIHVIDLGSLDLVDQQALVAVILDEIFKRASQLRKRPIFIVVEEAHNFAPSTGSALSTNAVIKIAREGRKFGVGLCIVSQRPSRVHPDVLSQCMTQIFKRIVNPNDLAYVKKVVESITEEDLWEVRVLSEDEALVTGVATPIPMLVKVKGRLTTHGGITPRIPLRK